LLTQEQLLSELTEALVLLTLVLIGVTFLIGIRAENRLNRLNQILTRLLRIEYIHIGVAVTRSVEMPTTELNTNVTEVVTKLNGLSPDGYVKTQITSDKLHVSYIFNLEAGVYGILRSALKDPSKLPPEEYSQLMS